MKAILQGFYQKEHFWLRLGVVLLAVFGMGFALSLLLLVNMGTDPCSMMSKAISAKIGMSFGNWQALMNTVLLVLVVIFGGRNLGFGTLANMFLIGYFVDFFTWIWNRVLPADFFTTLPVRIAVLIPSVILFILTAALYMDVDMGTAPYDAIPIIISGHLPKVPFKVIRIAFDFSVTMIGFSFGGKIGAMTVIMILALGPAHFPQAAAPHVSAGGPCSPINFLHRKELYHEKAFSCTDRRRMRIK